MNYNRSTELHIIITYTLLYSLRVFRRIIDLFKLNLIKCMQNNLMIDKSYRLHRFCGGGNA